MHEKKFMRTRFAAATMALMLGLGLTGCSGSAREATLSHENGAALHIELDKASEASLKQTEEGVTVKLSSGGEVEAKLIDSADADELVLAYHDNGSFAEMSTDVGTGFWYDTEEGSVHVMPVDGATYLYMFSADADAIRDLETSMTFNMTSAGAEDNSFASQVAENGVGTKEEQQDAALADEEEDRQVTEESSGEEDEEIGSESETSSAPSEDDGLVDPFA